MDREVRRILSEKPIIWNGNLEDDCSAIWAGIMLRAECIDDEHWWWAVSDHSVGEERKQIEIDSSNNHDHVCTTGKEAREFSENAAKKYLQFLKVESH